MEAQLRLLRVLQEKEFERVGGTETLKVDVRLIAATHRDLESRVAEGAFREDLYFRLKVFPILIPPLRNRKEDIPSLVQHFIRKKAREMGMTRIPYIADNSLEYLVDYDWPGNARELENDVERALIMSRDGHLSFSEFKPYSASSGIRAPVGNIAAPDSTEPVIPLDALIENHIRQTLTLTRGKVGGKAGAAELLKINPSTLRKKMQKLRIQFGREVSW